jgi:hypothetical protein
VTSEPFFSDKPGLPHGLKVTIFTEKEIYGALRIECTHAIYEVEAEGVTRRGASVKTFEPMGFRDPPNACIFLVENDSEGGRLLLDAKLFSTAELCLDTVHQITQKELERLTCQPDRATLRLPVSLAEEPRSSAMLDTSEAPIEGHAPRSDPSNEVGVWKSRGLALAGIATVAMLAAIIFSYQPWLVAKREPEPVARGSTTTSLTPTESEDSRQPATANRPQDSPVTFRELMTYVYEQASTSIQRDEFLRQHLGVRVTWDGLIGGVYDDNGGEISVIIFDEEDSSYAAFMTFPRILRPQLVVLNFGQKVTARCTFSKFDARPTLTNCELTKVWPLEQRTKP